MFVQSLVTGLPQWCRFIRVRRKTCDGAGCKACDGAEIQTDSGQQAQQDIDNDGAHQAKPKKLRHGIRTNQFQDAQFGCNMDTNT